MWMMNVDFMVILKEYDCVVNLEYSGGVQVLLFDGVDEFWMGFCVSFLNVEFKVQYVIGCDDLNMLFCVVVCWMLSGKYDGWGFFGIFMGKDVFVFGIMQVEFGEFIVGDIKLCCEWMFFDEILVWKQIFLQIGNF